MSRGSIGRPFATAEREPWYAGLASRAPAERLVFAGIVMFALYILMDVVASVAYDGYSYKDQTISELSAIGAPTRTFWLIMGVFYQVLAFGFASACSHLLAATARYASSAGCCSSRR